MNQYKSGLEGEALAEKYLCQQGMTLLERRYRGADGEIDLIMMEQDTVVFVEVKCRPDGQKGSGLMAVTASKQRRMTHAAQKYLILREWTEVSVRFDVVEITHDGLLHIPNAFMAKQ